MASQQETAQDILVRAKAFLKGHFVFTSWRHGDEYLNKDALYPDTEGTSDICKMMAELSEDGVETVVAPEKGGIILSQWVAYHLTKLLGRTVFAVYAEKTKDDSFTFLRGYDQFVKGHRVLVVEDVLTTGGSVHKVIDVVRDIGGTVVGVFAICNRGGVTKKVIGNVPWLQTLITVSMASWPEEECPLCKARVPINTEVGKGKEFLARKGPFAS